MDDLVMYRLESAQEKLSSAEILLKAGQYKDSIGRSYYAIFTAVRALLGRDGVDFSKHSGVIGYFQREYIKTGIFDKSIQDICRGHFKSGIAVIIMIFLWYQRQMQKSSITELGRC